LVAAREGKVFCFSCQTCRHALLPTAAEPFARLWSTGCCSVDVEGPAQPAYAESWSVSRPAPLGRFSIWSWPAVRGHPLRTPAPDWRFARPSPWGLPVLLARAQASLTVSRRVSVRKNGRCSTLIVINHQPLCTELAPSSTTRMSPISVGVLRVGPDHFGSSTVWR
jgi:hypothetical protein